MTGHTLENCAITGSCARPPIIYKQANCSDTTCDVSLHAQAADRVGQLLNTRESIEHLEQALTRVRWPAQDRGRGGGWASHRTCGSADYGGKEGGNDMSVYVSDATVCPATLQMNAPLLGDKGRWLTSGSVAQQLAPLLPLLREAILLCYAKDPRNPATLTGQKNKRAQQVYNILADSKTIYQMQVASVMMQHVFQPLYDAIGRQQHTLYGGSEGVLAAYHSVLAALDGMLISEISKKKRSSRPSQQYFGQVLASVKAEFPGEEQACRQHIVSHVHAVQSALKGRVHRVVQLHYRIADVTEEEWVLCEEQQAWVTVASDKAVAAGADIVEQWETMTEEDQSAVGKDVAQLLAAGGNLRRQLEEFSQGTLNSVTNRPEPLRKWLPLCEHLYLYFKYRLTSSAWVEGRFSVASNAARTRPNSTTATMSAVVRRHSNSTIMEYPTIIRFTDLEPGWRMGDPLPRLRSQDKSREVAVGQITAADLTDLQSEAQQIHKAVGPMYAADFIASFEKRQQRAPPREGQTEAITAPDGPEVDSEEEDDVPLWLLPGRSRANQDSPESDDDCTPLAVLATDHEDSAPLASLCRPGKAASSRTWEKGAKPRQFDEWGNVVPDDDPLATRKANYVWQDSEGVTVMLSHPVNRSRVSASTAVSEHGGRLSDYKFYSHIRVQDDGGDQHELDLRANDNKIAVVFYDEDPAGDKVLVYADIRAIYVTPAGEPFIEHGYLWDLDDLERDPGCAYFLRGLDRPIDANRELVNCDSIYHTHAACVEGVAYLYRGEDSTCLPGRAPDDEYYWSRAIDLKLGIEICADDVGKGRLL